MHVGGGGGVCVEFDPFPQHLLKLQQGLVCSKTKICAIFMSKKYGQGHHKQHFDSR